METFSTSGKLLMQFVFHITSILCYEIFISEQNKYFRFFDVFFLISPTYILSKLWKLAQQDFVSVTTSTGIMFLHSSQCLHQQYVVFSIFYTFISLLVAKEKNLQKYITQTLYKLNFYRNLSISEVTMVGFKTKLEMLDNSRFENFYYQRNQ